jgi:predicted alpha/beta-hydrolase family hydrolase
MINLRNKSSSLSMKTRSISFLVSPAIGKVTGEYIVPEKPICIMTFAHGAGAGMHHDFMVTMAKSLAAKEIATMRFNFPFMENKKGRPDSPAVAHAAIEAAINRAHKDFPSLPLFVSGKSFGGRMSSQYLATHPLSEVSGIIFFGFPLHQPGKPSIERADHLKDVKQPMLFLQGTRDELATFKLIEEVCASLRLATLVPIEGANHAFKAGKQDIMSILTNHTKTWIEKKLKKLKQAH